MRGPGPTDCLIRARAHRYEHTGKPAGEGSLRCTQCDRLAPLAVQHADANPPAGVDADFYRRAMLSVVPHTGAPIEPRGTCDDPFCCCHRAHAATAARDYLRAVDETDRAAEDRECS